MSTQAFADVSLRRDDSAAEDKGNLTIHRDSIQFDGRAQQLNLTDIQFISFSSPSIFNTSDWVKVEYGDNFQPAVVLLKGRKGASKTWQLYAALQHFPNSNQFECLIWAGMHLTSPLTLGVYPITRKAHIAINGDESITLSAPLLSKHEMALAEVESFTQELLTARRHRNNKISEWLIGVAIMGIIIAVIALATISKDNMTQSNVLSSTLSCFVALAFMSLWGVLLAMPIPLFSPTVQLFTLKLNNGYQWVFGVKPEQADQVAKTLQSWGIKSSTP